jgi:hypothetical protein
MLLRAVDEGADLDRDGDVDLHDYTRLQDCAREVDWPFAPTCALSDQNLDHVIDLDDFREWEVRMTGPK